MLEILDAVVETVPSVENVVFTGGEPFLLGEDLVTAVGAAAKRGLGTRIVTNGFWARTPRHAEHWVARLYDAGLGELNLSTGDDHQEWVPFESVANAALAAASAGIFTAVNVEEHDGAHFRVRDALFHPRIRFFLDHHPNHHLLLVTGGFWLALRSERNFSYSASAVCEALRGHTEGCDSIGRDLIVGPGRTLWGCCGLTANEIPTLKRSFASVHELLPLWRELVSDPLAIWLRLRGPFDMLQKLGPTTGAGKPDYVHPCLACRAALGPHENRERLYEIYPEILPSLAWAELFRRKFGLNG